MPPEGYGGLPSGFTTPFSQSDAQRKEVLSGALVGMMENRLFVTDAEEFKELSVKGDRNKRKFNMPAAKVEWLRAHCFKEGSDQVLELIKKSHELCNTRPELMLAYGRARLWGSTVWSRSCLRNAGSNTD